MEERRARYHLTLERDAFVYVSRESKVKCIFAQASSRTGDIQCIVFISAKRKLSSFLPQPLAPPAPCNPLQARRQHTRPRHPHRLRRAPDTPSLQKHARHRMLARPARKHLPRLPPDAVFLEQNHGRIEPLLRLRAAGGARNARNRAAQRALSEGAVLAFSFREDLSLWQVSTPAHELRFLQRRFFFEEHVPQPGAFAARRQSASAPPARRWRAPLRMHRRFVACR